MAVAGWSLAAAPQVTELKQPLEQHPWSQHLIVLIPILTVYFCLAFYRLDHQSLWVDEVLSIIRADPEGDFLARERWSAGHGPLYFRLLHLWGRWSTSEFALRALSTLFGAIAVALMYLMGLRLCHRWVAGIGALLLATSPFLIWYSQEVRYVTLMMATALFAMYTFHGALDAKRLGRWLLHGCSLILAIAAFVANVFLPLAQGLYLVCSPSRHPVLRRWLVCQLVVLALFAWWANDGRVDQLGGYWRRLFVHVTTSDQQNPSVRPSERLVTGGAREFTVMALPYTFFTFSAGFSLGPSVRELQASRSLATLRSHALVLAICSLIFGGLLVSGIAALWRQPQAGKFLLAWLAVPIIGVLGMSALIPEMAYNVRYVAMGLPAYFLIIAVGIASLRRPLLQTTLLAGALLVNGLSLSNYYFNPSYAREDARSAARYLEMATDSDDAIVIVGSDRVFKHYYKGELPIVTLRKAVIDDRLALAQRIQALGGAHDRLWLLSIRPWMADPKEITRAMLNDRYTTMGHQQLPGVDIHSYQLR